ncbi:alpha/beta fold hydrolase [Microbispora sp. H13382]|uniref:alpha/beta fold hydrolase n=1 Tax=Microbispora sp. H13382 TaxID=2729112 RepID=UPI001604895F|nr:alpha/beta fold hydrolase [Microbispora sp. H13382]
MTVGERQVHYLRAGCGLPVVLLHASPGDHRPLRELVRELAPWFSVYALDTPGHGGSDRLPAAEPGVEDYGAALGETLTALGLERVHLYGTHTGAKIALAFAVEHPERVASLVLDGLGISTPGERADQLANYLPPVLPRGDGTHLVAAWHQVRNMFLFWPWYREEPGARLSAAMPDPEQLHDVTAGLLEAGEAYPLAYRAAFTCDPVPMLARLAVPTLVLASPGDPLHAHLARIPAAGAGVRVEHPPFGAGPAHVAARLRAQATGCSAGVREAPEPPGPLLADRLSRRYVRTRLGQSLIRWIAPAAGARPLAVLPPAPASGRAVERLLARAGSSRPALAVDLPGTGDSELDGPLDVDAGELAGAVVDMLDEAGLDTVDLYGTGAGGAIAAEVARRHPARVHALALAALPDPDRVSAGLVAARTPDLTPDDHGIHLLRAWHLVRDGALRAGQVYDGRALGEPHRRVLDIVKAWPSYGSAFRVAALAALARQPADLRAPVVAADPIWDPFLAATEIIQPSSRRDGRGGVDELLSALDEAGT